MTMALKRTWFGTCINDTAYEFVQSWRFVSIVQFRKEKSFFPVGIIKF